MVTIGGGIILGVTRTMAVEVGYRYERVFTSNKPSTWATSSAACASGSASAVRVRQLETAGVIVRSRSRLCARAPLFGGAAGLRAAFAQVVVAGTIGAPETDLTPEQEQSAARRILDSRQALPARSHRAVTEMSRGRAIASARRSRSSTSRTRRRGPSTSRARPNGIRRRCALAAMLHSDLGAGGVSQRVTCRSSSSRSASPTAGSSSPTTGSRTPGSLRSRWNVTVARLLLANGEIGIAERIMLRVERSHPEHPQFFSRTAP